MKGDELMKLYKILTTAVIALTAVACALLVLSGIYAEKSNAESDKYFLRAHENTVALFKENEIIKVYDGIILNTLPESDIYTLKNGIEYENIEDADLAAEDYDG